MIEAPSTWAEAVFGELNSFTSRTLDPTRSPDELFELYSVPSFPSRIPESLPGIAIGSTKQLVEPADVLVCKINPRINRVWQVRPKRASRQIASSEWIVMRAPEVDPRFLRYFFSSPEFRELICQDVTGVGGSLTRAQPARVATFKIPIAPLNEQTRIADKLDAILARVGASRERIDRVPAILKRFRQSVLAAATSGELTKEWRTQRDRAVADWEHTTVGAIIERIEAGLNAQCEERPPRDGERGLVKISAVTWGTYDDSESKTLPAGKQVPASTRIRVGDFLISRANTLELVGACVIVKNVARPVFLSDKVLRLVMPEAIKPWLLYVLQSEHGRRQIERLASGNQLSMRNLSQANLRRIAVPAPPEDERQEIVRRVESLLACTDGLEARCTTARARVECLTPVLLAKAFSGELVPHDPNDEPASVLLERIRAARGAVTTKPRRKPLRSNGRPKIAPIPEVLMLNRKDIQPTHLSTILRNSGPLTAEALWAASHLDIDEFYDQLKDEETRGLLREQRGQSPNAPRLLETAA